MHRAIHLGAAHVPSFPPKANTTLPVPSVVNSQANAAGPGTLTSSHVPDAWTSPYDLALRILLP